MTINETIQEKLAEKFPGKIFRLIPEADPITFKSFNRLSVNGKRTDFGFYIDAWAEERATQGTDLLEIADRFIQSVRGIEIL
jgi:hypothetical protein